MSRTKKRRATYESVGLAIGISVAFCAASLFLLSTALLLYSLNYAPLVVLGFGYAWVLYAFFNYRQGRQEEFRHLLAAAVETNTPLVPALYAYVRDRPQGVVREFLIAAPLFIILPGYYWIWHRMHHFDSKIEDVAYHIEQGCSLSEALERTPGVVARETGVAISIGEATGQLAQCLRREPARGLGTIVLEILPRFLYPLLLLTCLSGFNFLWFTLVAARMQRIFADFSLKLPAQTLFVFEMQRWLPMFLGGFLLVVIGLCCLLYFVPTLCWYFPGLGRLYAIGVQGSIMRLLAVLVDVGKPLPEALGLLAGSSFFAGAVSRRLKMAGVQMSQGEPLADSLEKNQLLPRSMAPLVRSAQKARNLPWALTELGEVQASRLVRIARRISIVLSPIAVVAVGALAGFVVVALFLPLLSIMGELAK
jgi:type II secretory pathway component PulF